MFRDIFQNFVGIFDLLSVDTTIVTHIAAFTQRSLYSREVP